MAARSAQGPDLHPLSARRGKTEALTITSYQRVIKDYKPHEADGEGETTRTCETKPVLAWRRVALYPAVADDGGLSEQLADTEEWKPPRAAVPHSHIRKRCCPRDLYINLPFFAENLSSITGAPNSSDRTQNGRQGEGSPEGMAEVCGDSAVRELELGHTGLRCEDMGTRWERQPPQAAPEPSDGGLPAAGLTWGSHLGGGGACLTPGPEHGDTPTQALRP